MAYNLMIKEQQYHFMKIHSALGKNALVLEALTVDEGMSRLFEIQVVFIANQRLKDFKKQIGEPVSISLALGDQAAAKTRYFHGHILRIGELGKPLHNNEGQRYQAIIVPRAWSATSRTNYRIFQDKTALQILETILGEHSVRMTRKIIHPLYTYPYCVQYKESDWDFICRLLAHEGLSFFFEHTSDAHTLVITDNAKAYTQAAEGRVEFASRPTGEAQINQWHVDFQATANALTEQGFNFVKPAPVKENSDAKVPGDAFGSRELFDYVGEDASLIASTNLAHRHLQGLVQDAAGYRAKSDLRSFGVGKTFAFKKHEDAIPAHNEFVITSAFIHATVPVNSDSQSGRATPDFHNSFSCLPTSAVFQPKKLPKPLVHGLQTATVTCGDGAELHADEHGRIKVQFHWDREGKHNENSSCWIRVSQSWAGEGFGAQFLPRKGQEVLVAFMNGDPDQPLITGAVYNGQNKMPYAPNDPRRSSGIRSRSTTQGARENYSELRFDDQKGKELLLLHAEKDHALTVEHDQTDDVGNIRKAQVGNDDLLTVKNNQKVSSGKTITLEAGSNITFKSGAASMTLDSSGNISIKGALISVEGSRISLKGSKVTLN